MTLTIPRLELHTDLGCVAGSQRLATGGFIRNWHSAQTTKAEDSDESFPYSIPLTEEAASVVRERHVTRVWWSDTRIEEWEVRKVAKRLDNGGHVDVSCAPISYRLAEHGYVPDIVTSSRGKPLLDAGFAKLTLADAFQAYLVDNAPVAAVLPWLRVGSIASAVSATKISLNWSFASAQFVINAAVEQAQLVAGIPLIWRLVRNANVSYDITVLTVS